MQNRSRDLRPRGMRGAARHGIHFATRMCFGIRRLTNLFCVSGWPDRRGGNARSRLVSREARRTRSCQGSPWPSCPGVRRAEGPSGFPEREESGRAVKESSQLALHGSEGIPTQPRGERRDVRPERHRFIGKVRARPLWNLKTLIMNEFSEMFPLSTRAGGANDPAISSGPGKICRLPWPA